MRTIAVTNSKGGTAKTTTTVNLAAALGELGHRVLVIDLDPQGSASSWLGVDDVTEGVADAIRGRIPLAELLFETTAPGVVLVPASPSIVVADPSEETRIALGFLRAMDSLPALWDVVLVDCPPSLGYLGIAPLTACQEALVPVEAHVLAVTGLTSLLETMARVRRRLNPRLRLGGVVACRVNRTSLSRAIVQRLGEEFPESFIARSPGDGAAAHAQHPPRRSALIPDPDHAICTELHRGRRLPGSRPRVHGRLAPAD